MGVGGDEVHVVIGSSVQLGFGAYWDFRSDSLLKVGVQPLIGVEFGTVNGHVEDLDMAPMLGQAGLALLVHWFWLELGHCCRWCWPICMAGVVQVADIVTICDQKGSGFMNIASSKAFL